MKKKNDNFVAIVLYVILALLICAVIGLTITSCICIVKPNEDNLLTLNKLFDKVYVIALPKRKQHAIETFHSFGIKNFEIIEAVLKDNLPGREELIKRNIIIGMTN